jgi:hypothetical protein
VEVVDEDGTGSSRLASDTCSPSLTPEVTWVRTSPITPTVTLVAFRFEPLTTVTTWSVPTV